MITAQTYDPIFLPFEAFYGYELAEGILIREENTSEFLIHDDDILGPPRIRIEEIAPFQKIDPYRIKVSLTHTQHK